MGYSNRHRRNAQIQSAVIRERQRGGSLAICAVAIALALGCGDYGGGTDTPQSKNLQPAISPGMSQSQRVQAFETTLHPVLTASCGGGCHDTGASAPFTFANANATAAWSVITQFQKVNLNDPPDSGVVRKMRAGHNCAPNCQVLGDDMIVQITDWQSQIAAASINGPQVAVVGILSDIVPFTRGKEIKLGERYEQNLIAFYDFKEGSGTIAHDTSGVAPAMDLTLNNTQWMGSYGILMADSQAVATRSDSLKLYDWIAKPGYGSQQYTFEAWVNNANTTQEDARIIGFTNGSNDRNFSLDQQEYLYEVRNRSLAPGSDASGREDLTTYDQDAQETLQHVVVTYDPIRGRRIFVDSQFTGDADPLNGSRLWNWADYHRLSLGSSRSGGSRFWRGQFRMLGIYNQALTDEQIRQNYQVGIGKSVRLTFSLNTWTGDNSEVQFAVSELDLQSYLFCQPTFVGSNLDGLHLKNMRIAINPLTTAAPPAAGQAFVNLDMMLTGSSQQVSRQCSIVAMDLGPQSDSFAVIFEELAYFQDKITPIVIPYVVTSTVPSPANAAGVRDFSSINASMQDLVGIDPFLPRMINPGAVDPIQTIYEEIRQQLPPTSNAMAFASSHQIGITRLAFEYCTEMIDDPAARQAVFGAGFDSFFSDDVATGYGNAVDRALVIDRLVDQMLNTPQLANQPIRVNVVSTLETLAVDLRDNCTVCDAEGTRSITKGLCTAVLASAPVLVQ